MRRSLLTSYEGQIKIFLVLLVLFLAVAIYFDFHLLVIARDAIRDEAGARLSLEADLVRAELERDQMLRGLHAGPESVPYIPPTYLDRIARLKGMNSVEILTPEGRVLSSSDPERVGREDSLLVDGAGSTRRRLLAGERMVVPMGGRGADRDATLTAYRRIEDKSRIVVAFIRVQEDVPVLAGVELNLKIIAALQAGGLAFVLVLVIFFAHWLLQPYRRLLRAAGEAPGALPGLEGPAPGDEPDYLVAAFQGVLGTLRRQEQELTRLRPGGGDGAALPGDQLIGGITSAVLVFDREGRLTTLNASAERLLGVTRATALGRRHGDLLDGNWKLIDLVERSLRRGESHSREVVPLAGSSGRTTHLGAMVSPIRGAAVEGAAPIDGALCLLADLTEIQTLRERVGLKENLAALGEMSAGIAHQFRNSLAAIQGLARLIARQRAQGGDPPPAGGENAEAILREVDGIGQVVDDFLRYARPISLNLAEVDLADLVQDLVRDFRSDPRASGVEITVEGTFPRLVADEALLRQALQNLLVNAAESFALRADRGPDPPGAPAPRVVLRGGPRAEAEGGARIEVIDNGPGIADSDLPRIFKPFFTTKDQGTGLGLALVQKTAVVHDGQVEVESRAGRGTIFSLLLPARPGAASSSGPT
ncbi:MAG TPA: ATP-binding protein [Candidatus Polarisedimenticolia bacterium]|nr:ATP-binding protein [Candidatus Polarisedimenticolia bacterium]